MSGIKVEERKWGKFEVLLEEDTYLVKRLSFKPNGATSLQYHIHRDEVWVVVCGEGEAILSSEVSTDRIPLKTGDFVFVPRGTTHKIMSSDYEPLVIIEVWLGDILDEDDIVRLPE